jgi:hypothetical protein
MSVTVCPRLSQLLLLPIGSHGFQSGVFTLQRSVGTVSAHAKCVEVRIGSLNKNMWDWVSNEHVMQ